MKLDKIVQFLECFGVTNAQRYKRTGWIISSCPLQFWNHSEGKSSPEVFGVKIELGDPHCSCFACGYHGTLGALVQRIVGLNKLSPRIEAKWARANQLVWEAEETQEFDFDIPGIEEVMAAKKEGLHAFPEWWLGGFPGAWRSVGRGPISTHAMSPRPSVTPWTCAATRLNSVYAFPCATSPVSCAGCTAGR